MSCLHVWTDRFRAEWQPMDTNTYEILRPPPALLPDTRTAAAIEHDRGALLLRNESGEITEILTPGTWLEVRRISGLLA